MKVIISAGGTGGHIYPALAIINKLKENEKDLQILYIGTDNRMESKIVPEYNIPYLGISIEGINRKNIFKNIRVLKKLNSAKKLLKKEIKKFNPDIVIGVGGYVSYPVISVAHKLGYKTIIHEQNSIPGFTNKMLSRFVNKVLVSLPGSKDYFKGNNVVYTGNPRSEEVLKVKAINKKECGLSIDKKLVIIVMGSLGSMTMSKRLKEILPMFKNKDYEVLFITGKGYYEQYNDFKCSNVKIVPFLDNMLEYLKSSDLVVSRAGASMISELTVSGVPSILVPSPFVTNNHQYKNASELEKNNASVIIEEDKLNGKILLETIDLIFKDKNKYDKMVKANKKLGIEDSATRVYNEIIKVIKED